MLLNISGIEDLHSIICIFYSSFQNKWQELETLEMESILQICPNAIFHAFGLLVQGCIFLTSYRFVFVAHKNAIAEIQTTGLGYNPLFEICEIPLCTISQINRDEANTVISINCKDLRLAQFRCNFL